VVDKKLKRNMLVEHPAMTHQEIAAYFGVSRAAIAQVEIVALRKFKAAVEAKGFVFEDFFGEEWDKT
jgi:DNA-directed RNA polymerase sigma subunit (sigma70/sigma32)